MKNTCSVLNKKTPGKLFLSFLTLFSFTLVYGQPGITAFSPVSGPIGTSITITGTSFSATPSDNAVYFGPVRGTVTAATTTTLSVIVPAGAGFQPITVTVNGLIAYSAKPFLVTFTGGILSGASFSFDHTLEDTVNIENTDVATGDFNGDGKVDLAMVDRLNNKLVLYMNTSTNATISFAPAIYYTTGSQPNSIATGDLDGDGKLDIAIGNRVSNSVSVFLNISNAGNINLAPKIDFVTPDQTQDVALGDMDGDGKIDIVVGSTALPAVISVFRNTSSPGSISMASRRDLAVPYPATKLALADFNADGKTDIAATSNAINRLMVLTNSSSTGNISLAGGIEFTTGNFPETLVAGDIDGDNKPEISIANNYSSNITVYLNTSSAGTASFAAYPNISISDASDLVMTDVDGDGKTDLLVQKFSGGFRILRNISVSGSITFSSFDYSAACIEGIVGADWNNDGRVDLGLTCQALRVGIWKNRTSEPQITSFGPYTATAGTTIDIYGVKLNDVTSVSFGGTPAQSFSILSPTHITAIVDTGSSGDVTVTSPNGTGSKNGFVFIGVPTITSFSPTATSASQTVTILGTNFYNISSVKFGGVNAMSFTVDYPGQISAKVGYGASGDVTVSSPIGTASRPGFTYNGPLISSISPASGGTGSVITISGQNFTSGMVVNFGGVAASSVTVVSATTILATVSTGATGNVYIANGLSSFSFLGFTYTGPVITSFSPQSGSPGTVITITGKYFTGATAVSFGATAATSFTVVDSTKIAATVANGTSGTVSVTTSLGNATLAGFVYTGPPVINSFTPTAAASGAPITISGAHFTGATSVSFGGTQALSFTVVNQTTIKAIVAAGSSGSVTVTTPYGSASLAGFTYLLIPAINSFSPASGPAGTTVSINGSNFSPVAANNIVFFGAVKATVNSASATSLNVTVPFGATYQNISVTVNGLSGYSSKPFNVTFNNHGITYLSPASFAPPIEFTAISGSGMLDLSDLDGDGKTDIGMLNYNYGFSILRNLGSASTISFSPLQNMNLFVYGIFMFKDMDGDGKPDVVARSAGSSGFTIARNTSAIGSISFGTPLTLSTPTTYDQTIEDLDQDGKPDLMSVNIYDNVLYIFRNTSTIGNLSFDTKLDVSTLSHPEYVATGDINQDGRPDIVVNTENEILVYLNKSSKGLIVFDPALRFTPGGIGLAVGDFDNDGKIDIITSYNGLRVFRNTTSQGVVSFAVSTLLPNNFGGSTIKLSDLNGDGKPDLVITSGDPSIYWNTSTAGNISFQGKLQYNFLEGAAMGDVDGDGREDIISYKPNNATYISILKNLVGNYGITSFTPNVGVAGTVITIKGVNLLGVTSVKFGGVSASSFTIVDSATISAVVANGVTGTVSVTSPNGTAELGGFFYQSLPTITSFTPTSGTPGTTITIHGINIGGVQGVKFGGVPAASFIYYSDTLTKAVVAGGASGNVELVLPSGSITLPGFTFTYPPPTITNFSPNGGTNGTTVNFTGTNFTSVTNVSFGGVPAQSFTVNSPTSLTAVVGAGTSGPVSITAAGGTVTGNQFLYIVYTAITDPAINSKELTITPNPGSQLIIVNHPKTIHSSIITFTDVLGRMVRQIRLSAGSNQTSVSIVDLPQGVYQLVWSDGSRSLSKTLIVKK